jgi:hypothetical protein
MTHTIWSIKANARRAGWLYVVMSIVMIIGFMYIPGSIIVTGDAAATARNITEHALKYRIGILAALLSHVLFIFVVLSLYNLFKDVDQKHARLMLVLVCVGVAVEIVNVLNRMAPLVLLSGDNFLAVFSKPQLEALALTYLRLGNYLGRLAMALWGLWLIPFGILTIKSGYFPKVLGILLFISGFSYMAGCFTFIVLPNYADAVTRILMPFALAEVIMVLWLAIIGAKVPIQKAVIT